MGDGASSTRFWLLRRLYAWATYDGFCVSDYIGQPFNDEIKEAVHVLDLGLSGSQLSPEVSNFNAQMV